MSAHYYNTTHLSGEDLTQAIERASTQEDKVLALFKSTPGNEYTPCEVHALVGGFSPITSTRRAMTSLTTRCLLTKTANQRKGIYGSLNYTWVLPRDY